MKQKEHIVDGRYLIIGTLGRGGMAYVYRVKDREKQIELALKVMASHLDDPVSVTRFQREFEASKKLNHPNIVHLHDIGRLNNGGWYYTMDYLPYPNLKEKLIEKGPFEEKTVIDLVGKLAKAMAHYQKVGIVHRDLKLGNILLEPSGNPIIVDFGLARDEEMTALTATGAMLGTPFYMAPEMVRGERADIRADIWAIGVIIYELLTGQKPYQGEDLNALMMAISFKGYKSIDEVNPKLTHRWTEVLDGCLQKDKEDRFQSAHELVDALDRMARAKEPSAKHKKRRKKIEALKSISKEALDTAPHSKVHSSTGNNRPIIGLTFLLVTLLFAAYALWGAKEKIDYSVQSLRAQKTVDGARITWQSENHYETRIKVLHQGTEEIFEGKYGDDGRHEVLVTGLLEGKEYEYVILFPSGQQSMTKTFETARFQASFEGLKREKKKIRLFFRSSPRAKSSQLIVTAKNELVGPSITLDKDTFAHSLDYPDESAKKAELVITLGPNQVRRLDVGHLLLPSIESKCKTMSRFNAEKMAYQKEKTMALRLRESPFWKVYEELTELSPLVLTSRIFPLDKRIEFIESLRRVWDYHLCSILRKMEVKVSQPDFGTFAMAINPYEKEAKHVAIVWDGKNESIIAIGSKTLFSGHALPRWSKNFRLPNLAPYSRAEIAFSNDGLNQVGMIVKINRKLSLRVYGLPFIKMHYYRGVVAYQRIPIDVLREGENHLSLEIDSFFRGPTDRNVDLLYVRVNLYE